MNKKKKKRNNKKKKNKQGSKLPTTVGHVGKKPVTFDHVGSAFDAKNTQTTRKPKFPCRLCKGRNLLKDFLGLSKVIEAFPPKLQKIHATKPLKPNQAKFLH